jgi:hypothetical protein
LPLFSTLLVANRINKLEKKRKSFIIWRKDKDAPYPFVPSQITVLQLPPTSLNKTTRRWRCEASGCCGGVRRALARAVQPARWGGRAGRAQVRAAGQARRGLGAGGRSGAQARVRAAGLARAWSVSLSQLVLLLVSARGSHRGRRRCTCSVALPPPLLPTQDEARRHSRARSHLLSCWQRKRRSVAASCSCSTSLSLVMLHVESRAMLQQHVRWTKGGARIDLRWRRERVRAQPAVRSMRVPRLWKDGWGWHLPGPAGSGAESAAGDGDRVILCHCFSFLSESEAQGGIRWRDFDWCWGI